MLMDFELWHVIFQIKSLIFIDCSWQEYLSPNIFFYFHYFQSEFRPEWLPTLWLRILMSLAYVRSNWLNWVNNSLKQWRAVQSRTSISDHFILKGSHLFIRYLLHLHPDWWCTARINDRKFVYRSCNRSSAHSLLSCDRMICSDWKAIKSAHFAQQNKWRLSGRQFLRHSCYWSPELLFLREKINPSENASITMSEKKWRTCIKTPIDGMLCLL